MQWELKRVPDFFSVAQKTKKKISCRFHFTTFTHELRQCVGASQIGQERDVCDAGDATRQQQPTSQTWRRRRGGARHSPTGVTAFLQFLQRTITWLRLKRSIFNVFCIVKLAIIRLLSKTWTTFHQSSYSILSESEKSSIRHNENECERSSTNFDESENWGFSCDAADWDVRVPEVIKSRPQTPLDKIFEIFTKNQEILLHNRTKICGNKTKIDFNYFTYVVVVAYHQLTDRKNVI
jgi:hypothetical protein